MSGFENFIGEIREQGLGQEIARILDSSKKIYAEEVLKWAHIVKNGKAMMAQLEREFKEFSLVEHYSNSFTCKVSRDGKAIGFVFGMMEDFKKRYHIQEYSASQTTLEQIFNMFAKQAQNSQ